MTLRKLFVIVIGALLISCSSQDLESPLPTFAPTVVATITPVVQTSTPTVVATATLLVPTSTPTTAIGMVPEEYKAYIGITFPPLPDDLEEGFGTLIYPSKNNIDWTITVVTSGNDTMLWLSKRLQSGNPKVWQVSDILVLPALTNTEWLVPNGCRIDELHDPEIIAIADVSPTAFSLRHVDSSGIKAVWQANRDAGVFEEVEVNPSLDCYLDNMIEIKK